MLSKRKTLRRMALLLVLCAAAYVNQFAYLADSGRRGAGVYRGDSDMPPSLALITVALGPFRGLIVDALWWRVSDLQEQGEYFEIINITDWITTLDPRDPFVWTFHAWNLSYNIAYEFPTPETRWKWVEAGMKLLRDEGLKCNPGNKLIESELAYFFLDRISGFSEPARDYYIRRWAETMERYMKVGDRDELTMLASAKSGDLKRRAEELERKLRLKPSRMLRLDRKYGPFQWRLPQAQALYWGIRDNEKDYLQGDLNYRSVVGAAMRQAFLFGAIVEDKRSEMFVATNNFDITRSIVAYYKEKIEKGGYKAMDKNVFNDFAKRAAPILYAFDHRELAYEVYMAKMKLVANGDKRGFEEYVVGSLSLMLSDKKLPPGFKQSLIEMQLYNAYKALRDGDLDKAASLAGKADEQWREYQRFHSGPMALGKLPSFESLKLAALAKLVSRMRNKQRRRMAGVVHSDKAGMLGFSDKVEVSKLEVR